MITDLRESNQYARSSTPNTSYMRYKSRRYEAIIYLCITRIKSSSIEKMSSLVYFNDFKVDFVKQEVTYKNEVLHIEPKVYSLLAYFIRNCDRLVTKEELLENIWEGRSVSEWVLSKQIKNLRKLLGDDGKKQQFIRTIHRKGFRFTADIESRPSHDVTRPKPDNQISVPNGQLVGRSLEINEIINFIDKNQLVTIVGPGGVGKTRIAIDIANLVAKNRVYKVALVPLNTINEASEAPRLIAKSIGINLQIGSNVFSQLIEALKSDNYLLILDNFEHIIDAKKFVIELLESITSTKLLITSRQRLHLRIEQIYPLNPLSTANSASVSFETRNFSSAVTFFEISARKIKPDFTINTSNHDTVNRLCNLLDGLPLALELAAAQLRYMPLEHLMSSLSNGITCLADHSLDRPKIHHTINDAISWSYDQLHHDEQHLLAALSFAPAGNSFDVIDRLCKSLNINAATCIRSLVDKSMIQLQESNEKELRYSMLHLIREFALDKHGLMNNSDKVKQSLIKYLADKLEAIESARWSTGGDDWIEIIDIEYNNILTFLNWSLKDENDKRTGCRIVSILNFWWYRSGRQREGEYWINLALNYSGCLNEFHISLLHLGAGLLKYAKRELIEAKSYWNKSLDYFSQNKSSTHYAFSLCSLAATSIGYPKEFQQALTQFNESIDIVRKLNALPLLAHALNLKGELLREHDSLDQAATAYYEALSINIKLGDRYYQAINYANVSLTAFARSDFNTSIRFGLKGLYASWHLNSQVMTAWSLGELAGPLMAMKHSELSARLIGASESALASLGARRGPADEPVLLNVVQALKNIFSDDDYQRLYDEGSQWTLDKACSEIKLIEGKLNLDK
jgi:predicted ATPase/DNA-binding winged helix-turn-helix (wHTH) protein